MKLLTTKDLPGEPLNREWKTTLNFQLYERGLNIEWKKTLVKFKGEPADSWVGGYIFRITPFKWQKGSEHFWYDGPHCAWHFGPFTIFRDGEPCSVCDGRA